MIVLIFGQLAIEERRGAGRLGSVKGERRALEMYSEKIDGCLSAPGPAQTALPSAPQAVQNRGGDRRQRRLRPRC